MRIMNNGQRIIRFGAHDKHKLTPKGVVIVDEAVGKTLIRLYAPEVQDIDNIKADFDANNVTDHTGADLAPAAPTTQSFANPLESEVVKAALATAVSQAVEVALAQAAEQQKEAISQAVEVALAGRVDEEDADSQEDEGDNAPTTKAAGGKRGK